MAGAQKWDVTFYAEHGNHKLLQIWPFVRTVSVSEFKWWILAIIITIDSDGSGIKVKAIGSDIKDIQGVLYDLA